MSKIDNEISEAAKRRKRINLYKKIIVFFIVAMILLPTILCIVLFVRLNYVNNQLKELSKVVYNKESQQLVADVDVPDDSNEKETEPDYYVSNTNKPNGNDKEDVTEPSGEVDVTEPTTEEVPSKDDETDTDSDNPSETESQTDSEGTTEDDGIPGAKEYSAEVKQALSEGRKVVYLTFDDGPWYRTSELLDVLNSYNVKATFFVNYHEGYESELLRMRDEGHTIAMHSYTHKYEQVYGGLESFATEVFSLRDYLTSVTGIIPTIFRFPGGSSNSKTNEIDTYINYLNENDIVFYDWNVSSGDASNPSLTAEQIHRNVINGVNGQDVSVVLMHDAYNKDTTLEAVPKIIESLQAMNALILPITEDTVPVHHNF